MFRDLKEYQEIQKLYSEKVSKPENLEENQANRMKMKAIRDANKPKTREEVGLKNNVVKKPSPFERKFGAERNQQRLKQSGLAKPTTAEIRAKDKAAGGTGMSNIPKKEGSAVIDGKKLNPDFGKKSEIKPEVKKPEISKFTKQGKERTKAQMMAAKRIGSGTAKNPDTTIAQVKQSNQDAMRARAKEKFAAFKAKRAEKKAAMVAKEEYTPYDIVLEYLLSTEQAATIEEANYVMTEMDAETIQGIVEMDIMKMPVVNVLGGLAAGAAAVKGAASYLGRKAGEKSIKKTEPKKPGLIKTIKDKTDATNKAIKEMP